MVFFCSACVVSPNMVRKQYSGIKSVTQWCDVLSCGIWVWHMGPEWVNTTYVWRQK